MKRTVLICADVEEKSLLNLNCVFELNKTGKQNHNNVTKVYGKVMKIMEQGIEVHYFDEKFNGENILLKDEEIEKIFISKDNDITKLLVIK